MNTYNIHADSKLSKALVAIFKALNVTFEEVKDKSNEKEVIYDEEFVKKILATKNQKSTRVNPNNLWESIM